MDNNSAYFFPQEGDDARTQQAKEIERMKAGYGTTDSGISFNINNPDSYLNAINQDAFWKREDKLRKEAEEREDYELDRIVAAAKRNGINPVLLLDSLSGNAGAAASYSTSAAKTNNDSSSEKSREANSAHIFGALLAALGMIIARAI